MMIFVLLVTLIVCVVIWFSFNQVVLAKRKSKNDVLELLNKRNIFDISRIDNIDSSLEELEILSNDNLKLRGYYLENEKCSDNLVVIIHGYTDNHYLDFQFIDFYLKEGFNILMIDERGHGESEGKYATYGVNEKEDLKLWIDFMREKLGQVSMVGLHGQSMGASTSLMYGGKFHDVDFIIADCPYSDGKSILEYQFKEIGKIPPKPVYSVLNKLLRYKCGFSMEEVSPIKDIKNCNIPILFIHGKSDKTIPYSMSVDMFEERNNGDDKLLLIEGADHGMSYDMNSKEYEDAILEMLSKVKDKILLRVN